jgi:hypothetical protein
VTVGALQLISRNGQPAPGLAHRFTRRSRVVPNCQGRTVTVPVGAAPWRVEVSVDRTFKPSDYGLPDTRVLGVMVGFRYERAGKP